MNNKDRNVMNPLNWMLVIYEPILLYYAYKNVSNWLGRACFITFIFILIFYGCMYIYFSMKKRIDNEMV